MSVSPLLYTTDPPKKFPPPLAIPPFSSYKSPFEAPMRSTLPFKPPRKRPKALTNKGCCFPAKCGPETIAVPDSKWGFSEIRYAFDIAGCTSTYEEKSYFWPLALQHYRQSDDRSEYDGQLHYFVSHHANELKKDKLLEPSLQWLVDCWSIWTHDIKVRRSEGEHRGKKSIYYWVDTMQPVESLIDGLIRYETFTDLGVSLASHFAKQPLTPTRAAWLLSYCGSQRKHYEFADEQKDMDKARRDNYCPTRTVPELYALIMDDALLARAWTLVKRSKIVSDQPGYWNELAAKLALV